MEWIARNHREWVSKDGRFEVTPGEVVIQKPEIAIYFSGTCYALYDRSSEGVVCFRDLPQECKAKAKEILESELTQQSS